MKKVTLKKSIIGCTPNQKATAKSLGLKRVGDFILHEDNGALAGKVKVLAHLVTVETVENV
jgi:large subunit ribosomal protein L30